jgi:hypothetical protein
MMYRPSYATAFNDSAGPAQFRWPASSLRHVGNHDTIHVRRAMRACVTAIELSNSTHS